MWPRGPSPHPSSRSAPGGQKPPQLGLPTQPSLPAQLSTSRITHRCCQQTKEPMSHMSAQGAAWVKSGPQNQRERRKTLKSVKTSRPAGWSASGGAQVTESAEGLLTQATDRGESHPRQGAEKSHTVFRTSKPEPKESGHGYCKDSSASQAFHPTPLKTDFLSTGTGGAPGG